MTQILPFIAYPSIANHAVTGDRRTAALVAADGTLDWLCLPNFDGDPVFGALIDAQRGGYWRLGHSTPITGKQRYLDDSAAVVTEWGNDEWALEVTDVMAWPQQRRAPDDEGRRIVLRRLRCTLGQVPCAMRLRPRANFDTPATVRQTSHGASLAMGECQLALRATFPVTCSDDEARADFHMAKSDEHWAVLALGEDPDSWSADKIRRIFDETVKYWNDWLGNLTYRGPHAASMARSGLIVHLLGFAPKGSVVAAPTTSLPERIGGDRNYDYRYAWIRDASLSIAGLSLLGDQETATRYLDWLAGLQSSSEMPLQVCYHIDGGEELSQHASDDLSGYRGSKPVLFGNHAFDQVQHGALGYLADCALIHLEQGGEWKDAYWKLIERAASYILDHWQEPDSGIWELAQREQYVASKVMCWVVLDRAITIAERLGKDRPLQRWRETRDRIHAEVLTRGWSEQQRSFVQRYGSEALDAALLLIPVMGFLPADHPRVLSTVDRLVTALSIDGLMYRFDPLETPSSENIPLGQFEGAFLPCCFWLATAHAMAGRIEEAEAALQRVESLTNAAGLFAEEADARSGEMLGNFPLLFSQVEYVRSVLALKTAREALRRGEHSRNRGAHDYPKQYGDQPEYERPSARGRPRD